MVIKKRFSPKYLLLFLVFFCLLVGLGYYLRHNQNIKKMTDEYNKLQPTSVATCNALTNISPKPGDNVTSPLTITVTVDNTKACKWAVFEGRAGVALLEDSKGRKIGSAGLATTESWMTERPVVYTATMEFIQTPASNNLLLHIVEEKAANMGPEENGQTITIPLMYRAKK